LYQLVSFSSIFAQNNKDRHQTPAPYRHASLYGPLRLNVTSSIKPEVHNVSQRCRSRIEPRPQGICTKNFVKIGLAVPKICSQTDRQTNWSQYSAPYRGAVMNL